MLFLHFQSERREEEDLPTKHFFQLIFMGAPSFFRGPPNGVVIHLSRFHDWAKFLSNIFVAVFGKFRTFSPPLLERRGVLQVR